VGDLRDGDVLAVRLFHSFVCLSPVKFVKSFATWQHLAGAYRVESAVIFVGLTNVKIGLRTVMSDNYVHTGAETTATCLQLLALEATSRGRTVK